MKTVILRLEISDEEYDRCVEDYTREHAGHPPRNPECAIARDIQVFCYDLGQMHGSFEVLSLR